MSWRAICTSPCISSYEQRSARMLRVNSTLPAPMIATFVMRASLADTSGCPQRRAGFAAVLHEVFHNGIDLRVCARGATRGTMTGPKGQGGSDERRAELPGQGEGHRRRPRG